MCLFLVHVCWFHSIFNLFNWIAICRKKNVPITFVAGWKMKNKSLLQTCSRGGGSAFMVVASMHKMQQILHFMMCCLMEIQRVLTVFVWFFVLLNQPIYYLLFSYTFLSDIASLLPAYLSYFWVLSRIKTTYATHSFVCALRVSVFVCCAVFLCLFFILLFKEHVYIFNMLCFFWKVPT